MPEKPRAHRAYRPRHCAPAASCMCSQAASRKPPVPQAGSWTRFLRLGIDHGHHRVDQCARREILPGAGFDLLRVAFQQALIDRAFDIDAEPEPGLAVDQADQPPQFGRVLDLVLRLQKDRADNAGEARQLVEDRRYSAASAPRPAGRAIPPSGNPPGSPRARPMRPEATRRPLIVHLEEQQIRNLRDIGLVGHALIAQHMRVVPDLLDEREFVHFAIFPSSPRKRGPRACPWPEQGARLRCQLIVKIPPLRIVLLYQFQLPNSSPFLDPLLPQNCICHRFVKFGED